MLNNTDKKIKILFRHRSMEMGGVEKVLIRILENLNQEKYDTTVLLNLNQGELRNDIPPHVKKIALAKGKEEMSKNTILQKIQLLKRKLKLDKYSNHPKFIDKEILKEEYDVEIAMDWRDYQAVLNSSNKKSKKIGWIHSEINDPKFKPLLSMVLKSIPQFDTMIYGSNRVHHLLHETYPNLNYPNEKIIINPIPKEEIKEKASKPLETDFPKTNHPIFISVGRLHTRKGYHTLMEAHKKLLTDGFNHEIIIIGDGEEMENLKTQRKELEVEKTYHLLGNKMNPYTYLKKADFFILPSQSEAWPLILAEALILQKPTIGTDCGDVATVLEHNKTGLVINYDVNEMYEAMKRFLTESELIKGFKENLTSIDDKFDEQKVFNEIENTILETLNQ